MVVTDGAARLCDVGNTRLSRTLDVVAEREECIRADSDAGLLCNPRLLLLQRQNLRLDLEGLLPYALCQYVLILVGDIDINRIVAIRTADVVDKLQTEDLRMLTQAPVVRLVARQTGAVDAALLTRADADCLSVLDIADRVGLRVLQGNQRDNHIELCLLRQLLVLGDDVLKQIRADLEVVVTLLEGDAEDIAVLDRSRLIVRIDLDHVEGSSALGLEDLERLVGVARRDDAVGYLRLQIGCGCRVADVGQRSPVAVGAQTVSAACADVRAGNRRQVVLLNEVDLLLDIGQRQTDCRTGRRDMLEGRCGRISGCLLHLLDQLPAVERVTEVDIARLAVEYLDRQLALLHKDAGRLLIRIAAVFQFQFFHRDSSPVALT